LLYGPGIQNSLSACPTDLLIFVHLSTGFKKHRASSPAQPRTNPCQTCRASITLGEFGGAFPMTVIRQEDFVASVAGALQYISYYHPVDYITSLAKAYEREQSPAARDAMAQILINSRMCAEGHRPICQDTGIVNAFVKVGMDVRFEPAPGEEPKDLQQMVDEGVRRAYLDPDNKLRASIQADPAGKRTNTKDNTPAVVNVELVRGNTVELTVAAKGGGSEAKSKFAMLDPSDSVVEVSAGDVGYRHWRDGGEGDAAGQAIADGPHRYAGPARPRGEESRRGVAHRAL
jgi:hypothetical protein